MLLKDFVEVFYGNISLVCGDYCKEFHWGDNIPNKFLKMKVRSIYMDDYHVITVVI